MLTIFPQHLIEVVTYFKNKQDLPEGITFQVLNYNAVFGILGFDHANVTVAPNSYVNEVLLGRACILYEHGVRYIGVVSELEWTQQGRRYRQSFLGDWANRMKAFYLDSNDDVQETGYIENRASIARYGVRYKKLDYTDGDPAYIYAVDKMQGWVKYNGIPKVENLGSTTQENMTITITNLAYSLNWEFELPEAPPATSLSWDVAVPGGGTGVGNDYILVDEKANLEVGAELYIKLENEGQDDAPWFSHHTVVSMDDSDSPYKIFIDPPISIPSPFNYAVWPMGMERWLNLWLDDANTKELNIVRSYPVYYPATTLINSLSTPLEVFEYICSLSDFPFMRFAVEIRDEFIEISRQRDIVYGILSTPLTDENAAPIHYSTTPKGNYRLPFTTPGYGDRFATHYFYIREVAVEGTKDGVTVSHILGDDPKALLYLTLYDTFAKAYEEGLAENAGLYTGEPEPTPEGIIEESSSNATNTDEAQELADIIQEVQGNIPVPNQPNQPNQPNPYNPPRGRPEWQPY